MAQRDAGGLPVFFAPDGQPVFAGPEATDLDDHQRLARHLIDTAPVAPSSVLFARALWNGAARIHGAAALLQEALRRERTGRTTEGEALWPEVHAAWSRLQGSTAVRRQLAATANGLGIADAERVAGNVQNAAVAELLPALHAILGGDPLTGALSAHQKFHLQQLSVWKTDASADSWVMRWCRLARVVAARRLRGANDIEGAIDLFIDALTESGPSDERARVGSEAVELCRAWIQSLKEPSLAQCQAAQRKARRLAEALPLDFSAMRVLAAAEMRLGVAEVKQQDAFNSGALRFARAAALDPLSADPPELLKATRAALANSAAAVQQVRGQGRQLNAKGLQLLGEAKKHLAEADAFPSSKEGVAVREQRERAVHTQLCARLGLDPQDESSRQAIATLLRALALTEHDDAQHESPRAMVAALEPRLAGAPWDRIDALRAQFSNISDALLAELLPDPPLVTDPQTEACAAAAYHQLHPEPAPEKTPRPPLFDRWLAWSWLFSRRSLVTKASAACGVILLIGAAVFTGWHAWNSRARNSAYARFEAGVAADDASTSMAAARDFLAHLEAGIKDSRAPQVTAQYGKVLFQEMVRASRAADDARLNALAAEAKQLTRWLDDRSAGHAEGGQAI